MFALGLTALNFGLIANALHLLKGGENDGPMVGTAGSGFAGLTLFLAAIHSGWVAENEGLAVTLGMYGLLLLAFYFLQAKGLAAGPVANLCLVVVVYQVVMLAKGGFDFTSRVNQVLGVYVILVALFHLLLTGRVGAKPVGYVTLVAALGTMAITGPVGF